MDAVQVVGENLTEAPVKGQLVRERCRGGIPRDRRLGVGSECAPAGFGFLVFFVRSPQRQRVAWSQPGCGLQGLGVAFGRPVAGHGVTQSLQGAVVMLGQCRRCPRGWAGRVKVAVAGGSFPGRRSRRRQSGALLAAGCALAKVGRPLGRSGNLGLPCVSVLRPAVPVPRVCVLVRQAPGVPGLWRKHMPTAAFCVPALLKGLTALAGLGLGNSQSFPLGRQGLSQSANLLVFAQALDCRSDPSPLKDLCGHGQCGEFP